MKMIEFLEKDKDRLLTEITAGKTAERAIKTLENEVDKLLIQYNEQCGSDAERNTASYAMQAVRLALPLVDSVGETKVWEQGEDPEEKPKTKVSALAVILAVFGIALCVIGLIPLMKDNVNAGLKTDVLTAGLLILGGAILIFLAGMRTGRPKKTRKKKKIKEKTRQVDVFVDAEKVYRAFRQAILSVDQSLEEVQAAERWSKREQAGTIDGRAATGPEIDLFADLLAASYSQDPEYALEKIAEIKYYLHKQQIEVVDYSEETRQYFDLMPGSKRGTIRPAMVADGTVLKKGLASAGK